MAAGADGGSLFHRKDSSPRARAGSASSLGSLLGGGVGLPLIRARNSKDERRPSIKDEVLSNLLDSILEKCNESNLLSDLDLTVDIVKKKVMDGVQGEIKKQGELIKTFNEKLDA